MRHPWRFVTGSLVAAFLGIAGLDSAEAKS
jgi:hypothetical protein